MFEFKLGAKARSKVSGFEGAIVGRSHNHDGSDRYILQPPVKKDGTLPERLFFDDVELEILDESNTLPHVTVDFKHNMLDEAKCEITGFKGVITGFVEHMNGCLYAFVQPKVKENKLQDGAWVQLSDLKVTKPYKPKATAKPKASRPTGGFTSSIK